MDKVAEIKDVAVLDKISEIGLLCADDFAALAELSDELAQNFIQTQVFRTRTEMEISVLNDIKYPTPASKYWQATREMNVMFTETVRLSFKYRKAKVEIKIQQNKIDAEKDPLERELLQIDLEEKNFDLLQMEKTAKSRIDELRNWSEIKERESSGMNREELRDVDNPQLISYTKRFINQMLVMGNNGSPAENQNLMGQLQSSIKACIKQGVIDIVLADIHPNVRDKIKTEYGIK